VDASEKYDAFVSYSHKLDEQLAKRLQPELERFAKPWYRIRALHVFRDDVNLSANPDLWGSIREALAASRWLILLASPEAGRSEWIDREVTWWLDNKPDPTNHLLIAVTDGRAPWDSAQDPDANGAASIIPPVLRAHLGTEPRWVDLRGVRVPEPVDEYRTRFQDAIANLATPLWGISKDLLYGESIRQHRRAMRLARQAVIVMAALTIAAVAGGVYSYVQRNQALAQARLANSRQLVAEASALGASHPGLARQLLAEANRVDPTPQVEGALMNSLSLPGELDFSGGVRAEAYMPSEPVLAVCTDNGISLVNTATGRPLASVTSRTGYVSAVAFRPEGRIMATGGADGDVRLWDVSQPSQPRLIKKITASAGTVDGLAFGPSGDILAAAYDNQVVALWNVHSPTQPRLFSAFPAEGPLGIAVAISPDGSVLAASGTGTAVQLWDITTPGHPRKLAALAGSAADALAFSPDGNLLASGSQGDFDVRLWDVTHPARPHARAILPGHTGPVDALAFSPDGHTLASGSEDDTAKLWDLADPLQPSNIATLSGHAGFVKALAFSPDGQTLAGGSYDQSVFLWNMAGAGKTVPLATLSGSAGPVAFSPDNRYVVAGDPPKLWDISTPGNPRAVATLVSPAAYTGSVVALDFSPDSHLVDRKSVV
jgi:WD40 repeat protein